MKKLRALVLMHESLVPPKSIEGYTDEEILEWKTEFDVVTTLQDIGHEVLPLGVYDDLGDIRRAIKDFKPHVHFNLLEEFHGAGTFWIFAVLAGTSAAVYASCVPETKGLSLEEIEEEHASEAGKKKN